MVSTLGLSADVIGSSFFEALTIFEFLMAFVYVYIEEIVSAIISQKNW